MTHYAAITIDNARTVRIDRARVSSLLARYPQLSAREKSEILELIPCTASIPERPSRKRLSQNSDGSEAPPGAACL